MSIRELLEALEAALADAGLTVAPFNPNVRGDRVQAYWDGTVSAQSGERISYRVDVIPQDWQDAGDLFVTAWNAVAS